MKGRFQSRSVGARLSPGPAAMESSLQAPRPLSVP